MKFTLESSSSTNLIRSYQPGELRIAEHVLRHSCLVTADRIVGNWRPEAPGDLRLEDVEAVLALGPELVLLGTGLRQQFPAAAFRNAFTSRGIGLEVMDTGAACRTFNVLVQEERRVVAALLLETGPA